MRIATKIAAGYGVLIVLVLVVLSYQMILIDRMQSINRDLSGINFRASIVSLQLLRDLLFIESRFHRVLIDYRLPDATGCRVVQAFQEDAPDTGLAMMTAHHDLALEIWVRARGVPIFPKPLDLAKLTRWLEAPDPAPA